MQYYFIYCPKKLVLFVNVTRLLAMMIKYQNLLPFILLWVLTVWHSTSDSNLKLLDRAHIISDYFFRIFRLTLKNRNIGCLSMLDKILHNINHSLIANSLNSESQFVLLGIQLNKMIKSWLGITPTNSYSVLPMLLFVSWILYLHVCTKRIVELIL